MVNCRSEPGSRPGKPRCFSMRLPRVSPRRDASPRRPSTPPRRSARSGRTGSRNRCVLASSRQPATSTDQPSRKAADHHAVGDVHSMKRPLRQRHPERGHDRPSKRYRPMRRPAIQSLSPSAFAAASAHAPHSGMLSCFFHGFLSRFVPQRGEGPRHPLAGRVRHDHLVDEAALRRHERVGEARPRSPWSAPRSCSGSPSSER